MPITPKLLPVFAILVAAGSAAAQPAEPEILRPARRGLLLGFGVHAGHMSCESETDSCNGASEAGGVDFHIGTAVSQRLAILGEAWVMAHTEKNVTVEHVIVTLGAQYWIAPRVWLRGGVGTAHARFSYANILALSSETETVAAVMGAVGWDVMVGPRFAMDVQLRAGTGFYEERSATATSAALSLGFTWY